MSLQHAGFDRSFGEEQFRLAVEASPAAMILTGADGKIRFVNAETEHMFGYAAQELIGKSIDILVPARIRGAHASMRESFLAHPSKRPMGMGRDLKAMRRDGTEFPVEVGLTPIETDDGRIVLATVLDITARREAEDALARRATELEKANGRLARFAYVASHDLQEPLRKIVSFAGVLNDAIAASNESDVNYANDVLRTSALRARELVEDLLIFSRSINEAQRLEDLDIREQIEIALDDLSEAIREANARIDVDAPHLTIRADRIQLVRLMHNLISNALKYRKPREPAAVCIRAVQDEDRTIRLSVTDSGIGIEPKYQELIFEPFKRLHAKAEYPGSGIGLAICKSIADRHGWDITVRSQLGQGATFTVTAPAVQEPVSDGAGSPSRH